MSAAPDAWKGTAHAMRQQAAQANRQQVITFDHTWPRHNEPRRMLMGTTHRGSNNHLTTHRL
jgi:hypothetical protein